MCESRKNTPPYPYATLLGPLWVVGPKTGGPGLDLTCLDLTCLPMERRRRVRRPARIALV